MNSANTIQGEGSEARTQPQNPQKLVLRPHTVNLSSARFSLHPKPYILPLHPYTLNPTP